MLSVVPSQALVGTPDDVPGCDFVVPFVADISGSTGLNTLIVLTDAMGGWAGTTTAAALNYHYTVNTARSVTVHDANITGTPNDVYSTDAFTILAAMSSTARAALAVDIDGDGTNDHYAGYIYFDATEVENNTVGQFYFVNLAAGKAAAANIPMKEYSNNVYGTGREAAITSAVFRNEMLSISGTDTDMEMFSAQAMVNGKRLQASLLTAADAVTFYLFPRIFIADATAVNWFIFWMSANDPFTGGTLHCNVYNASETALSTNIPLDDELHVYDAALYLPAGLWTAYPHEGFIDMIITTNTDALRYLEVLGWVYQQATGTASESWTVMTPMWREATQ